MAEPCRQDENPPPGDHRPPDARRALRALDLDAGEVTLGGSTAVVRGHRVEGTTKGGRSRVISIDGETVTALREHFRRQAKERVAAGSAWVDSGGLVFVGKWGSPVSRYGHCPDGEDDQELQQAGHRAAQPDQIPHARLHDLRHLHATTLLLAGVAVHVVAARLGHADPAVTLRVYSHILREHAQGIGDVFAQAMRASVSKTVSSGKAEN
jgi:integrase